MIHFSVFRIHFTRKRRFARALARSPRGMALFRPCAAVLRRAAARSSFGRFQPRTGFAAHSIARRRRWKQTIRPNHPAGMAAAPIAQGYFTQKLP